MKLKKLPIGIQTFREVITRDLLYVDKTKQALNLLENYKYVFLSRPRRFGKSLFMDMLHNIYEGNQELFEGLHIYKKWDWSVKFPVIKISFSGGIRDAESLNENLLKLLKSNQDRLGVKCEETGNANFCFEELIEKVHQKYEQPVVVLIDEYDKPILDVLHDIEEAKAIRNGLRDFYSKIKESDRYLKFAMLTGVSRFAKVSIFSGLNNLEDISLHEDYSDVCGYTSREMEASFEPYLQNVDKAEIKKWYNGYNFLGEAVYNPFDILLFIKNKKQFKNYWFETGTPTMLIDLIKDRQYFLPNFEQLEVDESLINSFDIENISLETVMFQAGYLTIKEQIVSQENKTRYLLDFPNFEVQTSFYDYILNNIVLVSQKGQISDELYRIFNNGNVEDLEPLISQLFSSIAYNNFTNNNIENYEGFYASVLYAYFASLGVSISAEDVTNQGRIDLTVCVGDKTYIFEFKVISESPLSQIKEKKYYEKYSGDIYLIGIVFDRQKRNISQFEWEKVIG